MTTTSEASALDLAAYLRRVEYVTRRPVDPGELAHVLDQNFGLRLPDGSTLPVTPPPASS